MLLKNNFCFFMLLGSCIMGLSDASEVPSSSSQSHLKMLHQKRDFVLHIPSSEEDDYDLYGDIEDIFGHINNELSAIFLDQDEDSFNNEFLPKFKVFIEAASNSKDKRIAERLFSNPFPGKEDEFPNGIVSSLNTNIVVIYDHDKTTQEQKAKLWRMVSKLHGILTQCNYYKKEIEKGTDLRSFFKALTGMILPEEAHGEEQLPPNPLSSDSSASLGSDSSPARFSDAENKDPMTENFKFEALKQKEQESSLPADGTLSKNDRDEIIRYLKDLKPECDYRNNNGAKRPNSAPASNNRFNKKSRRNDLKTKRTKSVGCGRQWFSRGYLKKDLVGCENESSQHQLHEM